MHKTPLIVGLLGLGLTALAGEFWKDKAYTQWSDDEVTKMLSGSPWAQSTKASASNQGTGQRGGGMGRRGGGMGGPRIGYPGGGGGYPGGGGGYPGGGGGYPGGGGGYPRGGGSMPSFNVTIRWQSALPVREALLRQSGVTKPDDSQVAEKLTAPVTSYVIAVLGLPETLPSRGGRYGRSTDGDDRDRDSRDRDADQMDQMKSVTRLNPKDRASIYPEKVERDKDGMTILFTFPRTTPISLDEKEVEFVTHVGPVEIRHKFKLKDMAYQGKLEL